MSRVVPVDRAVDRQAVCLVDGRSGGRPTVPNGQNFDRWPIDWRVNSDLSSSQQLYFGEAINKPSLGLFSTRILQSYFLIFTRLLQQVFKEFLRQKIYLLFYFQGLKNQRKIVFGKLVLIFISISF